MIVIPSGTPHTGYNLQRSLRLRSGASAYLSRTPSAVGNRRTFTWSGWCKRGGLGAPFEFFSTPWTTGGSSSFLAFASDDTISFGTRSAGATVIQLSTSAKYRDCSAFYHVMLVVDTTSAIASDRARLYVNGVQISAFSTATYPAQNTDTEVNTTVQHRIGSILFDGAGSQFFDGLLTEVNFIDGQALTPSSFGEFDAITGVWQPKKYGGTYGTNGFYLPFTDNSGLTTSSNTGLGKDFSGNGNYWVTNNISLTAGATYDSFTDVPTLTSATAANFATLNPLYTGKSTLSNANLTASGTTDLPTIAPDSGTWYFEISGVSKTWTPPAAFPAAAGDYNFGQRPFTNTPTGTLLNTFNLPSGSVTTSGSFTGNANADGPFIYLKGTPTAMTINGNAVTFVTHADKLANGFKVRTASASYNTSGTNTYSISSVGSVLKYANAQVNP